VKQGRRELEAFLSLFACPACGDGLTLDVFHNDEDGVCQEGLLVCRGAGHWYSVSDGVPRLLRPGPLRPDDEPYG
jgi:uncharacterized protein YbaR (Trm112 family)